MLKKKLIVLQPSPLSPSCHYRQTELGGGKSQNFRGDGKSHGFVQCCCAYRAELLLAQRVLPMFSVEVQ